MNQRFLGFTLAWAVALLAGCQTPNQTARADNSPPPGFDALFNGANLAGWWGATTEDPRKYMALAPDNFKAKHDASLDDGSHDVAIYPHRNPEGLAL